MLDNVAQTKDAHFALRLPSVMLDNLRKVAASDGRSASQMAMRFIAAGIAATLPNREEAR